MEFNLQKFLLTMLIKSGWPLVDYDSDTDSEYFEASDYSFASSSFHTASEGPSEGDSSVFI
jgi:hypothetical protein